MLQGLVARFFRDLAEVNDASVASGASEIFEVRVLTAADLPAFNGPFAAATVAWGQQRVAGWYR